MIKEFAHKSDSSSKDIIGKDTLLHEAKLMCSIADGLIRFVNIKHPELLKNERKKYSLFFLKNALLRMDSCIVLLENGSSLLKCKDGSMFINPFSILTLIRSIYESLVVHYYYILIPGEKCVSDTLICLWKMSGMKNRLTVAADVPAFHEKYCLEKAEYEILKDNIKKSVVYTNTSDDEQKLLRKAMKELSLFKITKNGRKYVVTPSSYGKACSDIFSDTSIETKALIIYKHLSAISHPSYLNCIQTRAHDGSYNHYTETTFEGGIIYIKKLIDDVLQVIPEGQKYIGSLSLNQRTHFAKWELKQKAPTSNAGAEVFGL